LGIDRMSQFLGWFGFGSRTGIDIPGEFGGLLPSRAWKRAARKEGWYAGETVVIGIGQGYLLVTPLQMATFTGTLAARGERVVPKVVHSLEDAKTYELHVVDSVRLGDVPVKNPAYWNMIVESMTHVVHGARGTAKGISKDLKYTVAGKTGTAQVFTVKQDEKYKESEVDEKLRDHAWFVAFAPAENPRIAVCVLVENGGHGGSAAAPIARKVTDAYLVNQPTL
jgi:penicillin-binding protein 2